MNTARTSQVLPQEFAQESIQDFAQGLAQEFAQPVYIVIGHNYETGESEIADTGHVSEALAQAWLEDAWDPDCWPYDESACTIQKITYNPQAKPDRLRHPSISLMDLHTPTVKLIYRDAGTTVVREFWIPNNGGYVYEGTNQVCDGLTRRGPTLSAENGSDLLRVIRHEWKVLKESL